MFECFFKFFYYSVVLFWLGLVEFGFWVLIMFIIVDCVVIKLLLIVYMYFLLLDLLIFGNLIKLLYIIKLEKVVLDIMLLFLYYVILFFIFYGIG